MNLDKHLTGALSPASYRSEGLPRGSFSQVGNMHLHIDGAGNKELVLRIIKELESEGAPGKLNVILGEVPGPQRKDLPTTYASHTPGRLGENGFEYFSTSNLVDRQQTIKTLQETFSKLTDAGSGTVVEAELVVAMVDVSGKWSEINFDRQTPITSAEVGSPLSETLPFEIHHFIEIPKSPTEDSPPLTLGEVLQETTHQGLVVGGWYNFAREGSWSYRSNAFSQQEGVGDFAKTHHKIVECYLRQTGLTYSLRTIVERVLGVWHLG